MKNKVYFSRKRTFVGIAGLLLGLSLSCVPKLSSVSSLNRLPFLPVAMKATGDTLSETPVGGVLPVDTTKTDAPDLPLLQKYASLALSNQKEIRPNLNSDTGSPEWLRWGRFMGRRANVVTPAEFDSAGVLAYATTSKVGTTLFVANHSERTVQATAKIRLSPGVYKVERLKLSSPALLQNFVGADFATTSTLTKPLDLAPGDVVLIRCTSVSAVARTGYDNTLAQLKKLSGSYPDKSNRLRRMLKEGEPYLGALSPSRGGRERRVAGIHQFALYVTQAQALCRNYQSRNAVKEETGANVMAALEQLTDALSETSAALLEMTPQISLMQEKEKKTANVEVSLCNSGPHTAATVKLALDAESLPQGVTLEENEPVLFNAVKPGQTIRATFRLKLGTAQTASASPILPIADITYFVGKSPAHLRPRVW